MTFENNTLIYVSDPMCSWCYGFSEELSKIKERYADSLKFQTIMGGLRPYNTETIDSMREMLAHHWSAVEERSGLPFNHEILNNPEFVYDTEPPSRAVVVVRAMKAELEYDFLKRVQRAFYLQNMDTNKAATYTSVLVELGLDSAQFIKLFESDEFKSKVKDDFQLASDLGIRGFPTLVLKSKDELYAICRGYSEAVELYGKIDSLIEDVSSLQG